MKRFLSLLSLVFCAAVSGQNTYKPLVLGDSVTLKLGGFVRNEIFYDSRKTVDAVDGLFNIYPDLRLPDAGGRDINDIQYVNMLAITTRLNGLFTGPDVFGAKSSAFFEFDFTGYNLSNGVRFRQGWTKLKWQKSELLMGQFWHPYFMLENAPTVLGLNTGAPYACFNRSPQIRYTYSVTPGLSAFIAAVYQTASGTTGPAGPSLDYMRTSGVPEVVANLQYKLGQSLVIGVSGGAKAIKPRTSTTGTGGRYKTQNLVKSYNGQFYAAYTNGLLKAKISTMYGQNTYEYLMLGGYAVTSRDAVTGHETYTPTAHWYNWVNITYGKDFVVGIYAGFAKNLGTKENYLAGAGNTFERGEHIAYIYRISPHFSYRVKRFQFGMEFEQNAAAYGTADPANKGHVNKAYESKAMRVVGLMMYYF